MARGRFPWHRQRQLRTMHSIGDMATVPLVVPIPTKHRRKSNRCHYARTCREVAKLYYKQNGDTTGEQKKSERTRVALLRTRKPRPTGQHLSSQKHWLKMSGFPRKQSRRLRRKYVVAGKRGTKSCRECSLQNQPEMCRKRAQEEWNLKKEIGAKEGGVRKGCVRSSAQRLRLSPPHCSSCLPQRLFPSHRPFHALFYSNSPFSSEFTLSRPQNSKPLTTFACTNNTTSRYWLRNYRAMD